MAIITTHSDGPYYKWRVEAIGSPPPAQFDEDTTCEGVLYHDWQHGKAKADAATDFYNCQLSQAGGAVAGPPSGPDNLPTPIPETGPGGAYQPPPEPAPPPPPPTSGAQVDIATAASAGVTIGGKDYDSTQVAQMSAIYAAWKKRGANQRCLTVLCTIGEGEDGWEPDVCNSTNHCGVFQLDPDWQAQHDFRDTYYWALYALDNGFYGYGGIMHIEATHGSWTIGQMVEACQGAGPTFQDAADYYDTHVPQASNVAGWMLAGQAPAGTFTASPPAPAAPSTNTTAGFDSLVHELNWAGDFENLWAYVQGGADEAANMAGNFYTNRINQIDQIGW